MAIKQAKVITVTSAKGGTGKTTIALSLAGILSNKKLKTIIVDMDLHSGVVSASLNLKPTKDIYTLVNDYMNHGLKELEEYIIKYNDKSLVYVTDTGYINRKYLAKMTEKDIYIMEANHDEVMLMDGPYPRFLKERVISDKGHLSNKTTAKYLKKIIGRNTRYIVLAHLSEKNNTEEKVLEAIEEELGETNINILIAKQKEESPMIEV